MSNEDWNELDESYRSALSGALETAHPAVEQAGGDERAALQELIRVRDWVKNRRGQPEKLKNTGQTYIMIEKCETLDMLEWAIERARAALAHRAPEVCSECSDTGKVYDESGDGPWSCYAYTGNPEVIGYANGDELDNMLDDRTAVLSPGKTSFHTVPVYRLIRAALAQPSPKCVKCGGTGEADSGGVHPWGEPVLIPCDCETEQAEPELEPHIPAQTIAEAAIEQLIKSGAKHYQEFHFDLHLDGHEGARPVVVTVAFSDGPSAHELRMKAEQERDTALARVAELEMLLRKLSTNGLMQFSTVDEEMAVQAALGGAPVSQAQQLHDLDKQCRDDVARALGLRPSQERGFAWSYLLTSIKSCVKASEDSAQAQHSVPEGWMLVECGIWTQEQVDEMQKTVTRFRNSEFVDDRALAMAVADAGQCKAPEISLAELLAAAPGKEVGHE
ncbi:hypothetical protein N0619_20105 [Pseudomonas aeruginosa]|nr:hypothetical protein [Pseudomonas aeruginosa]MCT0628116.1 hypothetical protein [Pseudomonas aeruginosa]MCT0669457.1 hypothetical protein [Pseudomonas aeruginosa]